MSEYTFEIVPKNTLRVNLEELDQGYAIASLIDFSEVLEEYQDITLYQFLVSIKKLGYSVEAISSFKITRFNEDIPDDLFSQLLNYRSPSILVKRKLP